MFSGSESDKGVVTVGKDLSSLSDEDVLDIMDTCLHEDIEDVYSMRKFLERAWPRLISLQEANKV